MASTTMMTSLSNKQISTVSASSSLSSTLKPLRPSLARISRNTRLHRLSVRSEKIDTEKKEERSNWESDVKSSETYGIPPGEVSKENAEKRADIGESRAPTVGEVQAFDGPAPETINSRLSMLAAALALGFEFWDPSFGIAQQVATWPGAVLATFIVISLASYVPILRGYTRKEEAATGIWTPKAENWNGRLAMIGFAGMLLTEAISGSSVVATWNLPHF